ncbi:MAG: Sua5/YciO/YrdC/YwlC family protein, partial [Dehalococcoidia bacterium]
ASPTVNDVLTHLGAPVAASSANRHGDPSPTDVRQALALGKFVDLALDARLEQSRGIDSTVIDCSTGDVRILREGAIDRQTIARILGLSDIPVLRSVRQ